MSRSLGSLRQGTMALPWPPLITPVVPYYGTPTRIMAIPAALWHLGSCITGETQMPITVH